MTAALIGWLPAGLAAGAGGLALRRLRWTRRAVSCAEHELRGPLAAVLLAIDLGLRDGGLGAGQLSIVRAELRRAERALADLSRARHGLAPVTTMTELDVPRVVLDSVEAWRPVAVARGVTLEFTAAAHCAPLRGDPVRLAQATGNLIANAIEHGGSRVHVTAGNAAGQIKVAVSDDGPGLPPGIVGSRLDVRRVRAAWRRRRRPDAAGRSPASGDRGHGLALVAGIAAAQGGRLSACEQAQGASLVLELPAASRA